MPRCVIADDSKVIRMLLSRIMTNFGFEVSEVEDGEELLENCLTTQPELIISDWESPAMDGIDVLYKIRGYSRLKQPKFVFCSSFNDISKAQEAVDGGADDYIFRPFDEEIIATKLTILGLL